MVINVFKSRSQERELSDFGGQESPKSEMVSVFLQEFSEIFSPFLYHLQTSPLNEGHLQGDQGSLGQGVS